MRAPRSKPCFRCGLESAVLFRCRTDLTGAWRFVCRACYDAVAIDNPHYVYGGTWKAEKKH